MRLGKGSRVVLDTNVAVSALLFRVGRLAWLRLSWQAARFVPLVARASVEELVRVLAYPKFKLDDADRDDLLADYLPWCEVVRDVPHDASLPPCRDPDDVKFLALARAARADAIVTGDRDLLSLAGAFNVPILTAESFKASIG